MRTVALSAIAVSLALAMPAFAEESHHPAQPGGAPTTQAQADGKTVQKMQDNLGRMHTQLQRLAKAKTADKRQKLMDEHMKTMQENMGMATGMQSGMMDCPMMQGGMGMMGQGKVSQHDMMSKRMEMMMQGRMGMPLGEPPKPA
ncbi:MULTISPECIES: hypothetical protein [Candidatus Accumulibacter]|nr:hypothetical protein [Accumulibacter sp.]MBN8265049.1 hypothetical protein [Xanthomonadales bacterium]MCU0811984.1 hypothetical protein [Thiobacillaceae bacterium]HMV22535.1 hypothetical protein [Rhodocyclaceae bacterium]MCM8662106.1 hypothetical protein [Accumulibacter sp.]HRF71264.1 hypothetical protein [Accumulibacter sp.]